MLNPVDRARLCFIVESTTDVRYVEGLNEYFDLTLLIRPIGRRTMGHEPTDPVLTIQGPASRLRFAGWVCRYLSQHRDDFDFVLVQGYGPAAVGANLANRLTGLPVGMIACSPSEMYYFCRKTNPVEGKLFRSHEYLGVRALARLNALLGRRYIAISHHVAEVIHSHGVLSDKIHVIAAYGVDTQVFSPTSESKTTLKARLRLPTTGTLLFFSSRIAPEKDSQTLLRAVKRLLEQGQDIWVLNRSGGYQQFYEETLRLGIADHVIATDAVHPLHELPDSYRASDLCVQASVEEGLGFSPLEALACGIPVIASSVGGLRETIINGYTGWTYPTGDVEALTRQIVDVIDHPEEAARRASAGRKLVLEKYDRSVVFTKLVQLIDEVTGRRAQTDAEVL